MASILALDLVRAGYVVDLVTFGAPMVGSKGFASMMMRACDPQLTMVGPAGLTRPMLRCERIVNAADIVPGALTVVKGYTHFPELALKLDNIADSLVGLSHLLVTVQCGGRAFGSMCS